MANLTFDGVQYFQRGDDRTAFGLALLVTAMLTIVSSIVSSCWNQLQSAFSKPTIGEVVRKIRISQNPLFSCLFSLCRTMMSSKCVTRLQGSQIRSRAEFCRLDSELRRLPKRGLCEIQSSVNHVHLRQTDLVLMCMRLWSKETMHRALLLQIRAVGHIRKKRLLERFRATPARSTHQDRAR
jgi:hypothetical protein